MARQPTLGPAWLIGLLTQWGRRELYDMDKGLGYYSINPMLKDGIATPARSFEPIGYSSLDFSDLERNLKLLRKKQLLAVMRYAKPWKAASIDEEYPLDTDTWLHHLKNALEVLTTRLDAEKPCLFENCGYSPAS